MTTAQQNSDELAVRRRSRNIRGVVSSELEAQAQRVFQLNKEMNASKAAYDKARADLLKQMDASQVNSFNMSTAYNGDTYSLTVGVSIPETTSIDVEALRKQVSEEEFMRIVSATKAKVVEVVGSAVSEACSTIGAGTRNVSVKSQKQG